MDLQTRKLKAIGYLINLQDEKILNDGNNLRIQAFPDA
jgi:hypothetical protein